MTNPQWEFAVGKSIRSNANDSDYKVLATVTADGDDYYVLQSKGTIPFLRSKLAAETYFSLILGPEDMFIVGKMYVSSAYANNSGDTLLCVHVHEDFAYFEKTYCRTGHKTGSWTHIENRIYYSEMD